MIPKFVIEVTDYIQVDDERGRPQYWSMNVNTTIEGGSTLVSPITVFKNTVRQYTKEHIIWKAMEQALPGQIIVAMNQVKSNPQDTIADSEE